MKYSIVLKRIDDQTRFIDFINTGDLSSTLINIYKDVWNLIFDETSDKKFAPTVFFKFFVVIKLINKFYKSTHKKKLIDKYKNFGYVFDLIKKLLILFHYWTKQERVQIYILKYNTNLLLEPEQIILNNSSNYFVQETEIEKNEYKKI